MSLLEEAQALAPRPGGVCGVALLVRRLGPEEQAEFAEAIASDVSASALSKALSARGYDVNYQTISRHRARRCTCR